MQRRKLHFVHLISTLFSSWNELIVRYFNFKYKLCVNKQD